MDSPFPHNPEEMSEADILMGEFALNQTLRLYNQAVRKCFNQCITSFRSRNLDSSEKKCLENCGEKYFTHFQRMGMRFQEESKRAHEKKMAEALKEGAGTKV
jgi:import inner membrane translocase subunit TIM9